MNLGLSLSLGGMRAGGGGGATLVTPTSGGVVIEETASASIFSISETPGGVSIDA
jgi:hypothetical protein